MFWPAFSTRIGIHPGKRFGKMASIAASPRIRPDPDCPLCPRLADFRKAARKREPDWFNAPVDSFGDANAQLLIVGLAPGMQGANRTGRPFTGD